MDPAADALRAWLVLAERTPTWLARKVGVSAGHMHDILSGRRRPGRDLAVRLAKISAGAARVEDWSEALEDGVHDG